VSQICGGKNSYQIEEGILISYNYHTALQKLLLLKDSQSSFNQQTDPLIKRLSRCGGCISHSNQAEVAAGGPPNFR
jgi:hypothetical protein